jgi:hypothetical protein
MASKRRQRSQGVPATATSAKRPKESLQELQMRVSAAATKAQRSQRGPAMARKATRPTTCESMQPERMSATAAEGVMNLREGVSLTAARTRQWAQAPSKTPAVAVEARGPKANTEEL